MFLKQLAGIVLLPFLLLFACCCVNGQDGLPAKRLYEPLFKGRTLDGWEYDSVYWRVENGSLVGEVTAANLLRRNSFIIKKAFITGDFDFTVLEIDKNRILSVKVTIKNQTEE